MAKINRTYSIDNDLVEMLKKVPNASDFICNLLRNYKNEEETADVEKLRIKKKELFNETKVIDLKIKQIDEIINTVMEKEKLEEEKKRVKRLLEQFNKEGEELNRQLDANEIDEITYWKRVDERKIEKEKILQNGQNEEKNNRNGLRG